MRGRCRFARDRQTAAERHEAHEVVPADGLMVDFRVAAKIGQPLHKVVVNFLAGRALTDDKRLTGKFSEIDVPVAAESMPCRQYDVDAFCPEL